MLIGFSQKTSKIFSRLVCRHFCHCVVLFHATEIFGTTSNKNDFILIQIAADGIRLILITPSGVQKLRAAGWVFIKHSSVSAKKCFTRSGAPIGLLTCVGFVKRALGIHAPFIWTPDQLYRYLSK